MFGYFFVFALYYILCASHQLSSTWYESSFCFPLGILYSKYKQNINCYVFKSKNKTAIISILVFILFMATLFFGNKPLLISQIRILIKSISSLFFSVLTILIISFVSPKNIITSFLGEISLEIYLLQGIFLNIFRNQFPIKNDWLYVLTVIVFTIIFSVLSHPIYKYIGNITKKHRINKKLA